MLVGKSTEACKARSPGMIYVIGVSLGVRYDSLLVQVRNLRSSRSMALVRDRIIMGLSRDLTFQDGSYSCKTHQAHADSQLVVGNTSVERPSATSSIPASSHDDRLPATPNANVIYEASRTAPPGTRFNDVQSAASLIARTAPPGKKTSVVEILESLKTQSPVDDMASTLREMQGAMEILENGTLKDSQKTR